MTLGILTTAVSAESFPQEQFSSHEAAYQEGFRLMEISQGGRAEAVFRELIAALRDLADPDPDLLLRARVGLAFSLERQRNMEPAMEMLLPLLEEAREQQAYVVEARILIRLALIYEQTQPGSLCADYLRKAERLIDKHDLAAEWPQLAVRWSSYHRIYNDPDSSRYYAAIAAKLGTDFSQPIHAGDGYWLQGVMASNPTEATAYFEQASVHFAVAEDFLGSASILANLTKIAMEEGAFNRALLYTSDGLKHLDVIEISDPRELAYKLRLLRQRAEIFRLTQRMDSSLHYQQLASSTELRINEKFTEEKILEIEKRFETEKKNAQIAEQEARLQLERQRRILLTIGVIILVVLGGLLLLFYLRLQKAKQEVDRLAATALKNNVSLEASLQEQVMLQGELHHRVKNNLQIIISLLEMQSDDIEDEHARERLSIMGERIHSMAAIHEILYTREGVTNASFPEYVHRLCRHFMELSSPADSPRFSFDLEEVWFDLETLMPVGIILNELLTNTRKYATVPDKETRIEIFLHNESGRFTLCYRDNGPGFPNAAIEQKEGGLGLYLLDSMTRQLGGKVRTFNDNGAATELTFRAVSYRKEEIKAGKTNHSEHRSYHSEHHQWVG